jgi:transcriptional regulator with XRE-family HTH domain
MPTVTPSRSRLQEICDLLQISQRDLAAKSGVSEQTIRALLCGTHPPSLATAQAIADALGGASLEAVFPRESS